MRPKWAVTIRGVFYAKAHHFCIIYRNGGRVMVDVWSKDVELIDQFEVPVPREHRKSAKS